MTIREELSNILGIYVEPNKIRKQIKEMDTNGMITQKRMLQMIIMLCERMEKLEK